MMENSISFNDNDYIFKEGEPVDYVFQVLKGVVDISRRDNFLERLGVGDYIGVEGIVVGKTVYEYTARAFGDIELVPIYHADFLEMMKNDNKIAMYVSKRVTSNSPAFKEKTADAERNINKPVPKKSLLDEVHIENLGVNHHIVKVENNDDFVPPLQPKSIVANIFREKPENQSVLAKENFLTLVAKLEGDETGACKDWILETIRNIPLIKSGGVENALSIKMPLGGEVVNAKDLVDSFNANCLIWGGHDDTGRLLELHFTSNEDPYYDAGLGFSHFNAIFVPLSGGNDYYRLLRTAFLGAMSSKNKLQQENLSLLLEDALMKAHILIENPNINLSSKEHAYNMISYANACLKKGFFDKRGYKYLNEAIAIYNLALPLLPDVDARMIAFANHQLGRIYNFIANKSGALEDYKKAVSFFEISLKSTPKEITPLLWANVSFKLGELFFKLATMENKESHFFKSVSAFNNSATIYNEDYEPYKWAEIMNSIARVLFVHGEEYKDYEEITKGISLCEASLTVRSRDNFPILWANTKSNQASGLFLLGRFKKDKNMIYKAKESFAEAGTVYEKVAMHSQKVTADKNINLITEYLEEMRKDEDFARRIKMKNQTIFDAMENVDVSLDREEGYNEGKRRDIGEY